MRHLSYANVIATFSLFIALGGTSYAVLRVGSDDVLNNSLRSKDIRNDSLRSRDVHDRSLVARDVRRNVLGSAVVRESGLGVVPKAHDSDRLGGLTAQDLRLRCPGDTVPEAGVCIETSARPRNGFFGAMSQCDTAGRGLVTMPQLDRFARSNTLSEREWTSSVYRNPDNGPTATEQLEAVLVGTGASVSYDRVNLAVQHPFRCVALPSN